MMKITQKVIALASALVLLVCCVPIVGTPETVSAASEYPNTHVNTGNMAADLVAVAETQAGYCEGSLTGNPSSASSNNYQKYGLWYDNNVDYIGVQRAAWCAAFVSWCANQAGIPSSIVYYHAYCPYGVNWFRNKGQFQYAASRGGSYVPKAGDIVYFAPAGSSTSSHIGIVRYVSGGYVYTVEGNTSGQNGEVNEGGGVFLKSYSLSYSRLYGYGIPAYEDNSGHTINFDSNGGTAVNSVNVKDGGTIAQADMPVPTRVGFNFAGWCFNPDGTSPYDDSFVVTYGFTLYAKWEEAFWGANNNLMPNSQQMVINSYTHSDSSVTAEGIWPYWNDDGSVTMYNAVKDGSGNTVENAWPSSYMEYMNSFDSANDAYIYVKYDSTAQFNGFLDYMDAQGNSHSVRLSEIAGNGDADFPAGYQEFFINVGNYLAAQGHLTPAEGETFTGNVKFTKLTYFIVGPTDSYVRLYDMKFTPSFDIADHYVSLYDHNVTQQGGVAGSYNYNGGTLIMTSDSPNGYSVTFTPNAVINPGEMIYLLMDVNSEVPFNVTIELTNGNGDATMDFRNEFFDVFGLSEAPAAIPAGTYQAQMNLNGYYYWNGGSISESTIKSVTISLEGQGVLTLSALQASRSFVTEYVTNDIYTFDSYIAGVDQYITSSVYSVANGYVADVESATTLETLLSNIDQKENVYVYDAEGVQVTNLSSTIKSGMTVTLENGSTVLSSYTIVIKGDIDANGIADSSDAHLMLDGILGEYSMSSWQNIAADFDKNGEINTTDLRYLLLALLA